MKLVEINWKPTDRQLRQFAVICLFALPFIAWMWHAPPIGVGIAAGIGLAMALVGWFVPRVVAPIFVGFSLLALPIGLVVGEVVLCIIYFTVFLPIALIFRLRGRDALQRKAPADSQTYWQPKPKPSGAASYYRQS